MDCASFCLMSIAVALTPAADIQKCTYCVDVRGITPTCNHDIMQCAVQYPDLVVYCLTVNGIQHDGTVQRIVRCRSHSAYNASLDFARQILDREDCTFANSMSCDCTTCPLRQIPQTTTESARKLMTYKTRRPSMKELEKEILWPKKLSIPTYNNKSVNSQMRPKADSVYSEDQFFEESKSSTTCINLFLASFSMFITVNFLQ